MFLQLGHTRLEIYSASRQLVSECYKLTQSFPSEEKFALTQQIRRAAISVHLNIAEGSSRKSETDRKRFFEIARSSVIEIDAALDAASDLGYCQVENMQGLGEAIKKCFKLLSGLIAAEPKQNK
jgi:four helix bundle protein